jgi:hypothetical protein
MVARIVCKWESYVPTCFGSIDWARCPMAGIRRMTDFAVWSGRSFVDTCGCRVVDMRSVVAALVVIACQDPRFAWSDSLKPFGSS